MSTTFRLSAPPPRTFLLASTSQPTANTLPVFRSGARGFSFFFPVPLTEIKTRQGRSSEMEKKGRYPMERPHLEMVSHEHEPNDQRPTCCANSKTNTSAAIARAKTGYSMSCARTTATNAIMPARCCATPFPRRTGTRISAPNRAPSSLIWSCASSDWRTSSPAENPRPRRCRCGCRTTSGTTANSARASVKPAARLALPPSTDSCPRPARNIPCAAVAAPSPAACSRHRSRSAPAPGTCPDQLPGSRQRGSLQHQSGGDFIWSLIYTDIASQWIEGRAV